MAKEQLLVYGIDPGNTGGIVAMSDSGSVLKTWRMPVLKGKRPTLDLNEMEAIFKTFVGTPSLVCVEQIQPQGNSNGAVGMASLMKSCGEIHGLCHAMRLPYVEVPPKEWQKLLVGVPHPKAPPKSTEKEKAAARKAWKAEIMHAARRRWPHADLVGCKHPKATIHSGICDSIWLAEFARLKVTGKTLAIKETA